MKITKLIHITSLLLFLAAIALLFTNFHLTSEEGESTSPLSRVVVPPVPEVSHFAGEEIPLSRYDMYERYDRELTTFCYMHSTTLQVFKRANRIFPQIVPLLQANGIPEDFKYLASIESTLNPRAYSPARAAGLWQILASTAKEYGLEVNSYVDERYHTQKATEAACKYLHKAYDRYQNWTTAAASYNAGMGRITSQLDQQQAENSFDLLLVEETSRYVFRMMALKGVMESPTTHGFYIKAHQLYQPIATKSIQVDYAIHDLSQFAQEQGINYYQLKEFNPWLRSNKLPKVAGKTYQIEIPIAEAMEHKAPYTTYDSRWIINANNKVQ